MAIYSVRMDQSNQSSKPEPEWNWEERKATSRNFISRSEIQCGIDNKMFGLIASTRSAKKAWDTLQDMFKK